MKKNKTTKEGNKSPKRVIIVPADENGQPYGWGLLAINYFAIPNGIGIKLKRR